MRNQTPPMGTLFNHLCAGLIAAFLLTFANVASAHTTVKTSMPEDGAVYATLPDTLQLNFGQPVRLASVKIRKIDGQAVDVEFERAKSAAKSFAVPAPILSDGRYVLRWTAMAKDGHVMKGEIAFAIKSAAD